MAELLLIHSDTTDGSTTFTDSSPANLTLTAHLDVHHDSGQAKFGSTAIYLDGNGDRIDVSDSSDLAFTGDFTIDQWIYPSGAGSLSLVNYASANNFHALFLDSSTSGRILIGGANAITGITLTANTWQHYALVRSGTTLSVYIDGTLVTSITNSATIGASSSNYIGGSTAAAHTGHGYIDEVRITNTAEWTANFTPPTTPYDTASVLDLIEYWTEPYSLEPDGFILSFAEPWQTISDYLTTGYTEPMAYALIYNWQEPYIDTPQHLAYWREFYLAAPEYIRSFSEPYISAAEILAAWREEWQSQPAILAAWSEPYRVADAALLVSITEPYSLEEMSGLLPYWKEPYAMTIGSSLYQRVERVH